MNLEKILGMVSVQPIDDKTFKVTVTGTTTHTVSLTNASNSDCSFLCPYHL